MFLILKSRLNIFYNHNKRYNQGPILSCTVKEHSYFLDLINFAGLCLYELQSSKINTKIKHGIKTLVSEQTVMNKIRLILNLYMDQFK